MHPNSGSHVGKRMATSHGRLAPLFQSFKFEPMNFSVSTAEHAMVRGFVVFGIVAVCGARVLYRGIRQDIADNTGIPNGSRWWWIIAGAVLQVPLIGYAVFAYKQGFFDR